MREAARHQVAVEMDACKAGRFEYKTPFGGKGMRVLPLAASRCFALHHCFADTHNTTRPLRRPSPANLLRIPLCHPAANIESARPHFGETAWNKPC